MPYGRQAHPHSATSLYVPHSREGHQAGGFGEAGVACERFQIQAAGRNLHAIVSDILDYTELENGKLVTSGGRVTGTTAVADSLAEAVKKAYELADGVKFENAYRRSDIGKRALDALR